MLDLDLFSDYIDEQLEMLKSIVSSEYPKDRSINFIYDYELEDDISHNDIYEIQLEFIKRAKEYLINNNYIGKFLVYSDYCVHVAPIELFSKDELEKTYMQNRICK